jgi:hypothetical protein
MIAWGILAIVGSSNFTPIESSHLIFRIDLESEGQRMLIWEYNSPFLGCINGGASFNLHYLEIDGKMKFIIQMFIRDQHLWKEVEGWKKMYKRRQWILKYNKQSSHLPNWEGWSISIQVVPCRVTTFFSLLH